jgi:hypothetical protein
MLLKTMILSITVFGSSYLSAQDLNWERLRTLKTGERVEITTRDGKFLTGEFTSWSPEAIQIQRKRGTISLKPEDAERITVRRDGSRAKAALWGTLVGFAAAFPIGAAWAGHLTDRNNPGFGTRTGMGAGFGLFGGGIGAGIGALTGGKRTVTIYRAARRP